MMSKGSEGGHRYRIVDTGLRSLHEIQTTFSASVRECRCGANESMVAWEFVCRERKTVM